MADGGLGPDAVAGGGGFCGGMLPPAVGGIVKPPGDILERGKKCQIQTGNSCEF